MTVRAHISTLYTCKLNVHKYMAITAKIIKQLINNSLSIITPDRLKDGSEPFHAIRIPYFSSSGGTLHMPGAFPFFSRFNALCTSSSDGRAHEIAGSTGAVLAALTRSSALMEILSAVISPAASQASAGKLDGRKTPKQGTALTYQLAVPLSACGDVVPILWNPPSPQPLRSSPVTLGNGLPGVIPDSYKGKGAGTTARTVRVSHYCLSQARCLPTSYSPE